MMETIRVNMTPCEDVQTIHASQNDNEGREWGFELHNNGEKIDSSSISDQLVFKAYEGGTEQILPENGSTPTTSPFLGDIRYPQGLLSDQEFLYRESPTESDGLAKITDIKGNTLVWNQLVQNGNFADGVGRWTTGGANTLSVTDGVCKIQSTNTSTNNHHIVFPDPSIFQNGHTYLLRCEARAYGNMIGGSIFFAQQTNYINIGTIEGLESLTSAWKSGYLLFSRNDFTLTNGKRIVIGSLTTVTTDDYFELKNICVFDLTQMGLDITDPSDFTSLFSLPYYAYNQGTLLSFNGNGIKTVGFNQWDEEWEVGSISPTNGTNANLGTNRIRSKNYIPCLPNTQYSLWNGDGVYSYMYFYDGNKNFIGMGSIINANPRVDTTPSNCAYIRFRTNDNTDAVYNNNICLNISDTSKNGTYEPYTTSTLSLPISTYFPTGMKSAGSVYDELTETKAINRLIKTVVDGTNKTANYYGTFQGHQLFYIDLFATTYVNVSNMTNLKSNHYLTAGSATMDDRYIRYQTVAYPNINIGRIYWNDDQYASADAMNTALQSSPLEIVSLAQSETVEAFSVASLVTENAEIPLSNEDGTLIGKCTEELSENPGFIDAKIKLSDADGECYSNKIQLHIERSPQ